MLHAIDLALGFFRLKIVKEDEHTTASRDGDGHSWNVNTTCSGFKGLLSAYANRVGLTLGNLSINE